MYVSQHQGTLLICPLFRTQFHVYLKKILSVKNTVVENLINKMMPQSISKVYI